MIRSVPVRRAVLPVALALTAAVGTAPPAHAATGAAADELVDAYRSAYDTPGIAVAVIDGSTVETAVRGHDGDGAAVTPATRFRIASMSKPMTAAAVMLLVEQGEFTLDAPVVDVLPEFTMDDPRFRGITVRQLLDHTSGLSVSTNNEYVFPPPRSAADVVAELADKELAADPGEQWEYHNTNYSVAARIVEAVADEPFDDFLAEELFTPLGMDDTTATEGCADPAPGLASGYEVVLGVAVAAPEMPGRCVGNGGVVSTLEDMVRWVRFNQGALGSDLLSEESLEEMHTAQPGAGESGLGWEVRPAPAGGDGPLVAHGGTLATWTGDMAFSPASGTAAVVLTNGVGAPALLTTNLLAERAGAETTPVGNPMNIVNAVLLGLTLLAGTLLTTAVVRAPRWALRRREARRPRVVLRLVPLGLVTVLGLFLPTLIGVQGGSFSFQYWIVAAWLMPLLAVFSLVCLVLGTAALARRIRCLRRARWTP
ncbi:serine hydrolase domain-containing protein [Nocardiopsis suaedae]|uniref:Serine hydrolase n=1 Tax=Nocardiopsis suaedae TaxID=3018444 RepID=A0ABT4TI46_9ACTN|nr:serine hydrolase domain-containing protein [Nocardiopsis suaedae]MDA2804385.1 serine hydrolase [Nocardiopsis suaedae]